MEGKTLQELEEEDQRSALKRPRSTSSFSSRDEPPAQRPYFEGPSTSTSGPSNRGTPPPPVNFKKTSMPKFFRIAGDRTTYRMVAPEDEEERAAFPERWSNFKPGDVTKYEREYRARFSKAEWDEKLDTIEKSGRIIRGNGLPLPNGMVPSPTKSY